MTWRAIAIASWLLATATSWAHTPPAHIPPHDLIATQITPQIYVAHGPQDFPSRDTGGFMNNPGFIVGDGGVIVVDPGSSVQIGRQLLEAIRAVKALARSGSPGEKTGLGCLSHEPLDSRREASC